MGKNSNNFASMKDLIEEKKKLEKKMSKIKIPCSHTKSNGKLKVDFINGGTMARCQKCDCVFDFGRIDFAELDDAIETVHNAINQIKALSNDPDKESGVIKELGLMDYNLGEMAELYKRTINSYGKNKKKKNKNNNNNNSFGSYGASSISFIDGGKNNRKY